MFEFFHVKVQSKKRWRCHNVNFKRHGFLPLLLQQLEMGQGPVRVHQMPQGLHEQQGVDNLKRLFLRRTPGNHFQPSLIIASKSWLLDRILKLSLRNLRQYRCNISHNIEELRRY